MRTQALAVLAAVALSVLAPTWAEAKELTMRQKVTTTGVRADTHDATQYWTEKQMVTDSPDSRVIVDLAAETMTVANKRQQTYYTETFAQMRQRSEKMKATMQKQMEGLSPQAREMMGKMGVGPAALDAQVTVKPTGKTEKIAGYEAKEYVLEGGPMGASVWASDALQLPGGTKARDAVGKMIGGGGPGAKFAQAIADVSGVPLRTVVRSSSGGAQGFSSTTEVVEVSDKAPPAEVLKVPDGFKKTDPPVFNEHPGKGAPPH